MQFWKISGRSNMRIVYSILSFIAAVNIGVSVFLTTNRIVEYERNNKKRGYGSAAFFIFTIVGLYALSELRNYL